VAIEHIVVLEDGGENCTNIYLLNNEVIFTDKSPEQVVKEIEEATHES
jgi:hypothetical protein